VDGHSVPKQWLGKRTSTIETDFYAVRAVTVAMQWLGKHVSKVDAVFSAGFVQRSYLKRKNRATVPTSGEAGSNTSIVTLRVVVGDEGGSLKSDKVKYGQNHIQKTDPSSLRRRRSHKNKTETVKE
jgi:hypothetical protein